MMLQMKNKTKRITQVIRFVKSKNQIYNLV